MEVTPLSLGVQKVGGVMVVVVPRNTPIPLMKKENFTTVIENHMSVSCVVYGGWRTIVADNNLLGQFSLCGIPPTNIWKVFKSYLHSYFRND